MSDRDDFVEPPSAGSIPYAIGQATVVRVPIPGTNGLCIELRPRGRVPASGSTSTLFFQDVTGRRHLRLDYGFNVRSNAIDYHWNQKGVAAQFGLTDHAPAGRFGPAAYQAAKYFRHAGHALIVIGVAIDIVSIVRASRPMQRATEVVAGWAGAWVGCRVIGAGGAAIGTMASPLGTAIGGLGGCIVGGIGGYAVGSSVGRQVYTWAEGTIFTPIPETVQ